MKLFMKDNDERINNWPQHVVIPTGADDADTKVFSNLV